MAMLSMKINECDSVNRMRTVNIEKKTKKKITSIGDGINDDDDDYNNF